MTGAMDLDPTIVRTLHAKADQVSVEDGPVIDDVRSIDAPRPPAPVIRLTPPRLRRSRVAAVVVGAALVAGALGFGGWAGCGTPAGVGEPAAGTDVGATPVARQHGRS